MADKVIEKNDVATTKAEKEVKDKEKTDTPKKVEEEEEVEKTENGEAEDKENGKQEAEEETTDEKVCNVKRKSAGGDAPDGTPAEGATPEKKAKLDEPVAEAESNGKAEVAA